MIETGKSQLVLCLYVDKRKNEPEATGRWGDEDEKKSNGEGGKGDVAMILPLINYLA